MNLQEILSAGQATAISVGFLYLVYHLPALVRLWIDRSHQNAESERAHDVAAREWQSKERESDRLARHEANGQFMKAIAESHQMHRADIEKLVDAITAVRVALGDVCRRAE